MIYRLSLALVMSVVATLFVSPSIGMCDDSAAPATVRVGTFDSRAVALAYWRSDEGIKQLNDLRQKYKEAKADGDKAVIKRMDVEGPRLQSRMHQQVFSTGSVTDIVKKMKTALPPIAKSARVAIVVPESQVAYKDPAVEYVDLTSQLVDLFHPSENVRKTIDQLRKRAPFPIEKLSMDPKA